MYPLVVGTFWLGLPPQHYKNHNHPQSDSLQIPRLASIQKGYPSIQWVSKTTIKSSSKTGELFVAGQICCRTLLFFPHIPGLKSLQYKYKSSTKTIYQPSQGDQVGLAYKKYGTQPIGLGTNRSWKKHLYRRYVLPICSGIFMGDSVPRFFHMEGFTMASCQKRR